jgi:protein SCO1/2
MRASQWVITAVAVAGVAVVALALTSLTGPRQIGRTGGVASIGGPFLADDTGAMVTDKTLAGKPYAVYFGYTYCPDSCPMTLFDLTRWIKALGPNADKLNYVFVTVDPGRDTPKLMHEYLASFDERIRGFTAGADSEDCPGVSRLLQESPDQRRQLSHGPFGHDLSDDRRR